MKCYLFCSAQVRFLKIWLFKSLDKDLAIGSLPNLSTFSTWSKWKGILSFLLGNEESSSLSDQVDFPSFPDCYLMIFIKEKYWFGRKAEEIFFNDHYKSVLRLTILARELSNLTSITKNYWFGRQAEEFFQAEMHQNVHSPSICSTGHGNGWKVSLETISDSRVKKCCFHF